MLMWLFDDTNWKAEVFKRIDALAEKLGVAAGHLWQVLVRYGMVEGVVSLVLGALFLAGAVYAANVSCGAWKRGLLVDKQPYAEWPARILFPLIAGMCVSVTFTIAALIFIHDGALWAINPEYYALHELLELFK